MAMEKNTGISNRETPVEEELERQEHPPDSGPAQPQRTDEEAPNAANRQTSHKAGSRSVAQKEAGSRYPDRSMPASRKVAGAFGREPQEPDPVD
jgi:hypothetical protein